MNELSRAAVDAVDAGGMFDLVLAQPDHLIDAVRRIDEAAIPQRLELTGGMIVCGMGGSAIGGDLARAVVADRARRPIRVVRGYELEPWVRPDTLVVCASYSGNTEETLSVYEQARSEGLARLVITTGGELAAWAEADGVPIISPPAGMQPRASVMYMLVSVLACATACGAVPDMRGDVERAVELHAKLVGEWGPESQEYSLAKAVARRLRGTIPVVYGAGLTAPVAARWKAQLNENAEMPAFYSTLPEADHNEVCAWSGHAPYPMSAVFLDDIGLDHRMARRVELTCRLVNEGASWVERIDSRGWSPLQRVLSLVLLGDMVSVYLAVLDGIDPTPVAVIERFKAALR